MGLLLAFYTVIKYISNFIFVGFLHFSIEILFWIINGLLFSPFKSAIFSILCDTVFTFVTSGIALWMWQYAIVPPLISLVSWLFIYLYKKNNIWTVTLPIIVIFLLVGLSLTFFFIQLKNSSFKYEGFSKINSIPWLPYFLICLISLFSISSLIICLSLYVAKKNWKYIKWLYIMTMVITIIIIFRWIWGPYAFCAYLDRQHIKYDFYKKYPLTLFGIAMKSCLTIPIACLILIPLTNLIEKMKIYNQQENKFM